MKKIVFIAGGILIGWGIVCWYRNDQKKQKPANGTGATTTSPEMQPPSPAHQAPNLEVQESRPQAEMVITDQALQLAPMSQAVQYFDTNPAALYYRPRTTIAVGPEVAQDVITIDSANTYAR